MQGSRVNCLNRAGLAAFDKVVQHISRSTFPTNLAKLFTCYLVIKSNQCRTKITEDIAYI